MSNGSIVHALIPARGGSKGIPRKNIKKYKNKPLIAHTILAAKKTPSISRIIVSSDCPEIRKIAIEYGAEAPFHRPSNISGDFSPDISCFKQYLGWLNYKKQILPDIIVHLRPTYPERKESLIEDCVNKFLLYNNLYDSLRTVVKHDKSLFKMYLIENNVLIPTHTLYKNIVEPHNQARQILPNTYLHNGCVDIVKREVLEHGSMSGDRIYPYIMSTNEIYDIDSMKDWKQSEKSGKKERVPNRHTRSQSINIPIRKKLYHIL